MASDSDNDSGNDSLKLRPLLEKLPQELQDIIYDMTFTADPKVHIYAELEVVQRNKLKELVAECSSRVVEVNEDLHPHLLWVDRHSRQKFASSYYGPDSVFVIYPAPWWSVSSILGSHSDHISELRLVGNPFARAVLPELELRKMLVCGGMDAAFANRIIFIEHDDVVKLVKERAGISTEDAEVIKTPLERVNKAED